MGLNLQMKYLKQQKILIKRFSIPLGINLGEHPYQKGEPMYRIIAYHGKGKEQELEHDLKLLWDSLRHFVLHRQIQHVYCFQAVRGLASKNEASLFLVLQYGDNVAAKIASRGKMKLASQIRNRVDYWFYVREGDKQ